MEGGKLCTADSGSAVVVLRRYKAGIRSGILRLEPVIDGGYSRYRRSIDGRLRRFKRLPWPERKTAVTSSLPSPLLHPASQFANMSSPIIRMT
ncbi:hypothetical protein AOQ84DRAFT_209178 [Glonium stellatum]|uniref:Uncharacterized protein n=1 Tax=Glonium stellatum TaxID=574774 RepID=A0A8E2JVJ8_9PEZI|nr:hypothetical protein AOQ84DRAFT_209178 [Glonium stellatum]